MGSWFTAGERLHLNAVIIGKGVFRTQSDIYDGAFFLFLANGYKLLIIFAKNIWCFIMFGGVINTPRLGEEATARMCSVKKVLKNFAKFTRKCLCWSLSFYKVGGLRPATLLKKRLQHRCVFLWILRNF